MFSRHFQLAKAMLDKVNVSGVVGDHVKTLKNYRTGRFSRADLFLFFILPGLVAALLTVFYGSLQESLATMVATFLSISTVLLFNLLLIAYDLIGNKLGSANNNETDALKRRVFFEIFSNISFAILVALVAIVSVLILQLVKGSGAAEYVGSVIIFYLVTLFLLTLLMLLKRIHVLLRAEAGRS